jgi:hypothetical protein
MVRLKDLMDHIRWLLVMGPPVQYFARDGRWDFPGEVMMTYAHLMYAPTGTAVSRP